ncbi:protein phosphatase [Texcoconibacillus texcoconensis]|uniref:protein-serine/threonine phosphatase n=2 Tax=Texcoconibacillus texcoconensis TaxID=1095777 RepID=A0A840QL90_9BACI|nr:protein phosphatase [Texcoconibacillus texcoconensis]
MMDAVFRTHVGQLRAHNEDDGDYLNNQQGQLLVLVADGMGGHQAGDVASKMTKQAFRNKWEQVNEYLSADESKTWLETATKEVNEELISYARENPECLGMGTTLVVAICSDSFVTLAHVGDSRAYLGQGDSFQQVTEDHSLVNELVKSGQITESEAEHHPRKNVLMRALGTDDDVKVDINAVEWGQGDSLLLCSDGLTNKVSDEEIQEYVKGGQVTEIADRLIDVANERGGEDNVTVALVQHGNEKKSEGSS